MLHIKFSPDSKSGSFYLIGGPSGSGKSTFLRLINRAIALERLLGELRGRRLEVEARLCLGADYKEASQDMFRNAMRAGMIPSINSMMVVGIVFIPGMMTGQILAGADPVQAIRYQIIVMVMLVGSTAIGSLLVVYLVRKLCFGPGQRLLLQPKNP